MIEKIKEVYLKYKEVIDYLIFGILTTAVNFIVYYISNKVLGIEEVTSNIIAWILSVLFAYITNKIYVFESKTTNLKDTLKELSSFVGCRLLSGLIGDIILFILLVKIMSVNDFIAKIIIQIIVIILNYILSKLIIFRKK